VGSGLGRRFGGDAHGQLRQLAPGVAEGLVELALELRLARALEGLFDLLEAAQQVGLIQPLGELQTAADLEPGTFVPSVL
jgi:hypothetical protein